MNDILRDITSILTAVIGLALLAVLLKGGQGAQFVTSASTGFSKVLGTAMGGAAA